MLKCEGYMMFKGKATIIPKPFRGKVIPPYEQNGTWLYKPEYHCWYVNGHSYPEEIVDIENREEEVG